jgi:hypothetical protein
MPDGSTRQLAGVTQKQADLAQAGMRKRMSGGQPNAEEQAAIAAVGQAFRQAGGAGGPGGMRMGMNRRNLDTGNYIVFALRDGSARALPIRTGLTDMDYIEVLGGLTEGDTVLVLPTSGLLSSQREMRERFQRMTGGGGLPGVQQQQPTRPTAPAR